MGRQMSEEAKAKAIGQGEQLVSGAAKEEESSGPRSSARNAMGKAVVDEMRETIPEHLKEAILTARPKWAEQWPSQAHGNLRIIDMCEDHVRNALAVCLKAMREHDRMLASLRDNWRHGRIHLNEIDGLRFNTLLNRQLG